MGKTGGDINSDPEKIKIVKSLLEKKIEEEPVVFVVSGMRGITDQLITYLHTFDSSIDFFIGKIAKQHRELGRGLGLDQFEIDDAIGRELTELAGNLKYIKKWGLKDNKKTADEVISTGERLFINIFEKYLNENGVYAKAVTGSDIGLITDDNYGSAKILPEAVENVKRFFNEHVAKTKNRVLLVTGFDGTDGQFITTLGRSGSDQTNTFLGYALGADSVHLIKSVKGIMTADPELVTDAETIKVLSYELAREAGCVQEEAVKWAREANIPMYVHFIGDMDTKTTVQTNNGDSGYKLITGNEKTIYMSIKNIQDAPGTASKITGMLFNHGLNSAMISEGRNSIGFTIDNAKDYNVKSAIEELTKKGYQVMKPVECSLIRGVGEIDDDDHLDFMIAFREFKKQSGLEKPFAKSAYDSETYSASIAIPRGFFTQAIKFMHDKMIKK